MTDDLPRLAMTMGDPGGIGPEILVRAWGQPGLHAAARLVAVGSPGVLAEAARRWAPQLRIVPALPPLPAASPALLPLLMADEIAFPHVTLGGISAANGESSYRAVVQATQAVLAGMLDGLVTGPISKAAWHAAGHHVPGHTELLGALCGNVPSAMMLYLPPGAGAGPQGLGVVHATLHCSVRQALTQIRTKTIVEHGRMLDQTLRRLMARSSPHPPRIAVCALNPHAGEDGLFGDEEQTIIAPGVAQLVADGIHAVGPLPADTLLARAVAGAFDGVIAMLHDQGHIALKLLNMHGAVNVTLGLPLTRTSVAHGTAFDIAWQGQARVEGLQAAVETCARLVTGTNRTEGTSGT